MADRTLMERVVLGSRVVGVGTVVMTGLAIATYEAPESSGDGTRLNLTGLFFVVAILIGLFAILEGGLLSNYVQAKRSTTWPGRLYTAGALLGSLAGTLAVLALVTFLPVIGPAANFALEPVSGVLSGAMMVLWVVGILVSLAGSVGDLIDRAPD